MAVLEPYNGGYYLWRYIPSIPAAAIFAVLFALATIAHCWRIWRTRMWSAIPFCIGGLMEVVGYATRVTAHDATGSLTPYITQISLILLAPVLFAASIYMTLKGIIHNAHGEIHSPIRPEWLSKLFVSGDVLSLVIQCSGAAMMVSPARAKLGQNVAVMGLLVQIIIFGLFWATALIFHRRMRRESMKGPTQEDARGCEQTLYMLYVVSALIMLRSIFRVVEFVMGMDGYLLSNEWTLYVFDSVPMLTVMAVFGWWFPAMTEGSSSVHSGSSLIDLSPRGGDAERKGTS